MATNLWVALIIAIALFAGLLMPYLIQEIRRGKIELGPRFPSGAGDIRPGHLGNPAPGQPVPRTPPDRAMLSLRSFHTVFIALSIILAAGTGTWALRNQQVLLGALSWGVAVLLVLYWNSARKTA